MCRHETGLLSILNTVFSFFQERSNTRIIIEVATQFSIDSLVHPVLVLLLTTQIEVVIVFDEIDILEYHIPYFLHSIAVEARIAQHFRHPSTLGSREEMERIAEVCSRHVTAIDVVSITFIDHNAVSYLHDTTLNALQFVASSCHLYQQEEIDHGVASRLTLSYSYSLDEYLVVTSSFTEDDSLAGLACNATKRAGRW